MSYQHTRPPLIDAARRWALIQAESKANTPAGQARATERWIDETYARYVARVSQPVHGPDNTIEFRSPLDRDAWLCREYLGDTEIQAGRQMRAEFSRRASWEHDKQEAASVPAFCRAILYATDAPDKILRRWKRQSGKLLGPGTLYNRIAAVAYGRCDWGRLRKTYKGKNGTFAGIRTATNGKQGWYCVSWHYADFTAILSQDRRHLWVRYPNRSTHTYSLTAQGTARIAGMIVRNVVPSTQPVLRVHHLRRYYSAPVRRLAGVTWVWDRAEKQGYYRTADGERYHTEARPVGHARDHYHQAIQAFITRRAEKIVTEKRAAAERFLREHPERVWVSVEDSVTAGNCPVGTHAFADPLLVELSDGYPCAVRADVILARRNDSFTRRACVQAAVAH